jgi:hypothetical protein
MWETRTVGDPVAEARRHTDTRAAATLPSCAGSVTLSSHLLLSFRVQVGVGLGAWGLGPYRVRKVLGLLGFEIWVWV